MIVNYINSGWEIITQRAHGLLAAQLAWHWKNGSRENRWVLAIADHDDTGIEFDANNLLTDAGGPVHFAMRSFDAEHCQKLSLASQAKSRHIALLSAMHLIFLYRKESRRNPVARKFLEEQRRLVMRLRRELEIPAAQAQHTYALLQWCDALSLLICRHALQPEQRLMEISKGPDKHSYEICQLAPTRLSIHPWPFDTNRFTIGVESRCISMLSFANDREFKKALYSAKVRESVYQLVKPRMRIA